MYLLHVLFGLVNVRISCSVRLGKTVELSIGGTLHLYVTKVGKNGNPFLEGFWVCILDVKIPLCKFF